MRCRFLKRGELEAARFALAEAVRTAGNAGQWSSNRIVGRHAESDLARIIAPPFRGPSDQVEGSPVGAAAGVVGGAPPAGAAAAAAAASCSCVSGSVA